LQNDSFTILLDSIESKVKLSENKIFTLNYFNKSKARFVVEYYFKNRELILVRIKEQSSKFDELYQFSDFYISNNKVVDENYGHTVNPCFIGQNIEDYGYQNFSANFLKYYFPELLAKIKQKSTVFWRDDK